MIEKQRMIAETLINDVLFDGGMGQHNYNSRIVNAIYILCSPTCLQLYNHNSYINLLPVYYYNTMYGETCLFSYDLFIRLFIS